MGKEIMTRKPGSKVIELKSGFNFFFSNRYLVKSEY